MRKLTFGATLFVALVAASVASAQGTVRGAQEGAAAGGQAAGPVGAVVGGAVGAATGTVGGDSWSSTDYSAVGRGLPAEWSRPGVQVRAAGMVTTRSVSCDTGSSSAILMSTGW